MMSWVTVILLPAAWAQPGPTVSGYVYDLDNQQPLTGVHVTVYGQQTGTTTDVRGHFNITLTTKEEYKLVFSFVGYASQSFILPPKDTVLTTSLAAGTTLNEVVVSALGNQRFDKTAQLNHIDVPVEQLNKVPALLGEKDALKVIQLLPGVQKESEGNTGIYVRGGGPDQNLILLDGATVYNPNHLLGFFSAFNSDALSRVELTKGGFPARFGGRMSSVIELDTKSGNPDSLRTEASLGILSSRITMDGPLGSDKVSFMVAARRTYLDLVTRPIDKLTGNGAAAMQSYFYDLNAKVQAQFGLRNKLTLSGFLSQDRFVNFRKPIGNSRQAGLGWQNRVAVLRWERSISAKDLAQWTASYSYYNLSISNNEWLGSGANVAQLYALRYQSGIRDVALQYNRERLLGESHIMRSGIQAVYHRFTPDAIVLPNGGGEIRSEQHYIDALESGIWIEDTWKVTKRWRFNGGIRFSNYMLMDEGVLSPGGKIHLNPGSSAIPNGSYSSRNPEGVVGLMQNFRMEPRFSVTYVTQSNISVNASYTTMNQYIHLLSSTGVGLPTDLWLPATDQLRPQHARQMTVGMAKDLPKSGLVLSLEAYQKAMNNLVSYTEGASFLSRTDSVGSQSWSENITSGRGWSSGIELLIRKRTTADWLPRLSGWIGYTLSRTRWQFDALNGGRPFYPRYDRRHDASVVLLFDLSPTMTLGSTWVYGSGNALTLPLSRFTGYTNQPVTANSTVPSEVLFGDGPNVREYGERNGLRAEPYHRLDVSWQIRRQRRTYERTWTIGVYNAYNRRNPFYYSLEGKNQGPGLPSATVLYRYSVFSFLPSASYSIKF